MWRGRGVPRVGARNGDAARGRSVMLLLMLLRRIQGMDRKPPVTLALSGIMGWLHFQKLIRPSRFTQYSLCPDQVLHKMQLSRVVASAFLHADDIHLYHNLMSFLWKGYHLEHRFNSLRFALVVLLLLLFSHLLVVVLAVGLDITSVLPGQAKRCSIGFSGVLFALKVLLNHGSPAFSSVYGFRVPTKYAAWLELVVIHLAVPRASFIGHMCGILAGYIFVFTKSEQLVIDPLTAALSNLWIFVSLPADPNVATPAHAAPTQRDQEVPTHSDTFLRYQAYEQQSIPTPPAEISREELRRRRMARFHDQ